MNYNMLKANQLIVCNIYTRSADILAHFNHCHFILFLPKTFNNFFVKNL